MEKPNKSPVIAGIINFLVPGSSHLYINKDWSRFLKTLLSGVILYVAAGALGYLLQNTRGYPLPKGLVPGILILAIAAFFFVGGMKIASERNNERNDADLYNSKRIVSHESDAIKHRKLQTMRAEGLISEQEYDEKDAAVDAKAKK